MKQFLIGILVLACILPVHAAETFQLVSIETLNQKPLQLAEGPAFDGDSAVYFTEISASQIHRFLIRENRLELVWSDTQNTNGMQFDRQGRLWACEQGTGSIVIRKPESDKKSVLVGSFKGQRFNHPNDLSLDLAGGVYFTDPAWNESMQHQPLNGVYYASSDGNALLLRKDLERPNGVMLSQDEDYLYIADMGADKVWRHKVLAPGKLSEGKRFAPEVSIISPDGIDEDKAGRIYIATQDGIRIFSPEGKHLGLITFAERPLNLEFYGDGKMFVTSYHNAYAVIYTFN